jgi:hypothetical protein
MCFVMRTRQHMYVAHDARSHTHNRVRAYRHTKHKHACMPCTYTYLHSSAQRNSIYHAQMCPTTHASRLCAALTLMFAVWCFGQALQQCAALPHCRWSCFQGCTHICMCEKSDTAHVRSSRSAIPFTQPSTRSCTLMHTWMPTYQI